MEPPSKSDWRMHGVRIVHGDELDLNTRLFKYPCSYLIYSPAFDALPPVIKEPIYRRMWEVLQKQENGQAVIDILRDTRHDLPAYWRVS